MAHPLIGTAVTSISNFLPRLLLTVTLTMTVLSPGLCRGQEKQVSHATQTWVQYYAQATLNPRWTLQLDGGWRWRNDFRENSAYIVRSSAGYAPSVNLRVSAGLAHLGLFLADTLSRVELRPYQELQLTQPFPKFNLIHRYRLEERIFYPVSEGRIEATDRFNFRFRYAVGLRMPLFRLSKDNPDAVFVLEVGDEIFLQFGPQVTHTFFDQNRLLISPTFRFNKSFAVSLTWNNQFASTATSGAYAHNQVFWLQVRQQFDFSRKSTPAN